MHRTWLILILVLATLVAVPVLTACGSNHAAVTPTSTLTTTPEATSSPSATSSTADTVAHPMRIISLAPSNTEIVYALGLGDELVADTDYADYPAAAKDKPKIGGYSTVDIEKVIELNPDLVLASDIQKDTTVPELKQRGINVVLLDPSNVEQVMQAIQQVGDLTGKSQQAAQLVDQMQARINAVTAKTATLSQDQRPSVFYITYADSTQIWTLGADTLTSELIQMAGGTNVFGDGQGNFQTDLETVVWRNPQVILAATGHGSDGSTPLDWVQSESSLKDVAAVKDGKVYEVDTAITTRPGPRIVDALETLAKLLHPELFNASE